MSNRIHPSLALLIPLILSSLAAAPRPSCAADPAEPSVNASITVMTFNVLCSFCDRSHFDPWEDRLNYFVEIFRKHSPDLIALQEISKGSEVKQFTDLNPEYDAIYFRGDGTVGADGKQKDYPDATILWRRDRFEKIEEGVFWLSRDPDKAWAKGWAAAAFWRLAVWGHFKDRRSGRELYFLSTHFDNNKPNQEMSAPLMLSRAEPWASRALTIIAGDFNSKPDSPAYATLAGGVADAAGARGGFKLPNTFDLAGADWKAVSNADPPAPYNPASRIDHIFVAGPAEPKVTQWRVDQSVFGPQRRFPSDHFPISVRIHPN